MTDVIAAKAKLGEYADELDKLSKELTQVERMLEPVSEEVQKFKDDFELGLYHRSVNDTDFKLPAEKIREKLAVRALAPDVYGRHLALVASRDRMRRRIGDLKALVEAQRSILSAEKTHMEASEGRAEPQWSGV